MPKFLIPITLIEVYNLASYQEALGSIFKYSPPADTCKYEF